MWERDVEPCATVRIQRECYYDCSIMDSMAFRSLAVRGIRRTRELAIDDRSYLSRDTYVLLLISC